MHRDLLLGNSTDKLRLNPRTALSRNLEEVAANADYEVTFCLKRPQPAFVALPARGIRRSGCPGASLEPALALGVLRHAAANGRPPTMATGQRPSRASTK